MKLKQKKELYEAEFQAKLMDNQLEVSEEVAEHLALIGGFLTFDDIAYAEDAKAYVCHRRLMKQDASKN